LLLLPQSSQAEADIFIASQVLSDMPGLGFGDAARDFLNSMVMTWEGQQASPGSGDTKLLMCVDRYDLRNHSPRLLPRGEYDFVANIPKPKRTCMGGKAQPGGT
jgi:hypothetical protein